MAVIYFYCDTHFVENKTSVYALGSLLRQMFLQCRLGDNSPVAQQLKSLHKAASVKPGLGFNFGAEVQKVCAEIRRMAGYFTHVYIIVDGLEECQDPFGQDLVVRLSMVVGGNINVMINSLLWPTWHNVLHFVPPNRHPVFWSIDFAAIQEDIGKYLDFRLANDYRFKKSSKRLKSQVRKVLLSLSRSRYI